MLLAVPEAILTHTKVRSISSAGLSLQKELCVRDALLYSGLRLVSNSFSEANIDWVVYFINLGLTNLLRPQDIVRALYVGLQPTIFNGPGVARSVLQTPL